MPRSLAWLLALVLALGFALKLERGMTQPLGPQAAASGNLARSLADAGWQSLGEVALLADGSFTAQFFQRGPCRLEVALLPPGPQYLDVLREAWGEQARFLDEAGFGAAPPGQGRWRKLSRHLGHVLGLNPRPALFGLAVASAGECPVRLWQEMAQLAR
jgi:hypothetical protein